MTEHQPGRALREIARQQTHAVRPPLSTLLSKQDPQGQAIADAFRTHGYAMREIAEHLGLHYSTVSRRIRQAEEEGKGL